MSTLTAVVRATNSLVTMADFNRGNETAEQPTPAEFMRFATDLINRLDVLADIREIECHFNSKVSPRLELTATIRDGAIEGVKLPTITLKSWVPCPGKWITVASGYVKDVPIESPDKLNHAITVAAGASAASRAIATSQTSMTR